MENPVIGFIGLGLMGGNMVECLQKNGIEPVIMGRNRKAVDAAVARGADLTVPSRQKDVALPRPAHCSAVGRGNIPCQYPPRSASGRWAGSLGQAGSAY